MELTPIFDNKRPLYLQLYLFTKKSIEEGRIAPYEKLPSIRQLTKHLNISKTTVENAYQQLLAEGYVESRPRIGLVVLPLDDLIQKNASGEVENDQQLEERKYKIDFQYGDIDLNHFPFRQWKKFMRDVWNEQSTEIYNYGEKQGDILLRKEISHYLFQSRGIACHPNQIVVCAGTQSAIDIVCHLLKIADKKVAMENPGYDGVRTVFQQHGCKIKPLTIEKDGLSIEDLLRSDAEVAYATPSHQFPYGMVLSIQKRLKLLQWAIDQQSYIIEDDYDSEFRYEGHPISSLKSLDSEDRVIYLGTFSKSFLPSLRISYIVLPNSLIKNYKEIYQLHNQAVSPIFQRALQQFIHHGDFNRHLRKMRKIYYQKHKTLIEAIDKHFGDKIKVIGEKAGLHVLLDVKGRNEDELIAKAESIHIKIYSTSSYWIGNEKKRPSLILLGFGGLSNEAIEEGIRQLNIVWDI
ncbi:PLP-dependent aminotransferase family protein [Cytobacillus horneckiae]|uniref:MocR-like pyridoxine biosynthesis transcription factor PdxR n=1 Tax=Cytobacillus horneckiae TaxID=549687 RepID=UPI0039A33064